jgi:replication-associated recombination protein RarA
MDEIMEDAVPAAQPASSREEHRAIAMMTSPWIEKYRPDSLADIIAHQDIMTTRKTAARVLFMRDMHRLVGFPNGLTPSFTVNKFVDCNKLPHLLLYGPPGTGKTSSVLALAKRMFGAKFKASRTCCAYVHRDSYWLGVVVPG